MCYPVDCPCVPSFCQAAYDKVRKARKQAAERTQKLDERRKKVKLGRWHRGAGALRFTWVVFMQLRHLCSCSFSSSHSELWAPVLGTTGFSGVAPEGQS